MPNAVFNDARTDGLRRVPWRSRASMPTERYRRAKMNRPARANGCRGVVFSPAISVCLVEWRRSGSRQCSESPSLSSTFVNRCLRLRRCRLCHRIRRRDRQRIFEKRRMAVGKFSGTRLIAELWFLKTHAPGSQEAVSFVGKGAGITAMFRAGVANPVRREFGRTSCRRDRRVPCGLAATPL